MAIITKEEVKKIAELSRIAVSESELELLASEMEAVLSYASSLKEIAASSPDLTASLPANINVTRPDIAHECDPEAVLALAPEREENYFVVPVIVKEER